MKRLGFLAFMVAALFGMTAQAQAAWTPNMTAGIHALSRSIYRLHILMYWWCVAIAVVVFGWMIYSIIRFRRSQGAVPDTRPVRNAGADIVWTAVPVLILIGMAIPATRVLIERSRADFDAWLRTPKTLQQPSEAAPAAPVEAAAPVAPTHTG